MLRPGYMGPIPPPPHEFLYYYRAEVERVVDGDTVYMSIDLGFHSWRRGESIRLGRIDAPEPHTTTREQGIAATAFLRDLLPVGQKVVIHTDLDKADAFRRYIAEIWLDATNVNDLMVARGHAVYKEY